MQRKVWYWLSPDGSVNRCWDEAAARWRAGAFGGRVEAREFGPAVTWLTLTSYFLDLVFGGRRGRLGKVLGNAAFLGFSLLAWPLRYLDRWLIKLPNAHRLAFGVYCTAVKP